MSVETKKPCEKLQKLMTRVSGNAGSRMSKAEMQRLRQEIKLLKDKCFKNHQTMTQVAEEMREKMDNLYQLDTSGE